MYEEDVTAIDPSDGVDPVTDPLVDSVSDLPESVSDLPDSVSDPLLDADMILGEADGVGVRHPSVEEVLGSACADAEGYQVVANRELARLVFSVGAAFDLARAFPRVYVPVGAAQKAPSVEEADFAERSVAFDLALRLNLSENVVRSYALQAQALNASLPRLRALFVAGGISGQHVRAAVDNAQGLPNTDATQRYDERLAAIAGRTRPGEFARRARLLRERLCADSLQERHEQALARRRTSFEPAPDGMAWASGFVSAVDAARAEARLTAEARRLRTLEGENRTLDQIRADLYIRWLTGDAGGFDGRTGAENVAGAAGGEGPDVVDVPGVHVASADGPVPAAGTLDAMLSVPSGVQPFLLIDADGRFAELLGYGPVDPVTAARALRNAPSFRRVFVDPVTPTRLILDRRQYRPSRDQRRWLRLNYGFADAASPYVSLDAEVDHVIEWQHGGSTNVQNLLPLKPRLHRLKSVTRIRIDPKPDGGVRVRTPTGYDSDPPPF